MKLKLVTFLAITSCIIGICYTQHQRVVKRIEAPPEVLKVLKSISEGSEEFALDLFKKVASALKDIPDRADFMISPFSIWSLLILLVEGAEGNTLAELKKTLRINADPTIIREAYKRINQALRVNTTTLEVSTMQALFSDINRPVDRDFEDIIERIYQADLVPVDFHNSLQAYYTVNYYVQNATRGLITHVINEDDLRDAQLILISAIYFRGQWTNPFNRSMTRNEQFFTEKNTPLKDVPMMYQRGEFSHAMIDQLDSFAIELPYGVENRLSMIILLPKKGVPLFNVIDKLSRTKTSVIVDGLDKARAEAEKYGDDQEVELYLPRFTTTTDFTLNVILESMGILDLFNPAKANLSKVSQHSAYLSRLLHKTTIDVNEEGTVASAISGAVIINKIAPPKFLINRPFAYIIMEKSTNSLLFCGQVINP